MAFDDFAVPVSGQDCENFYEDEYLSQTEMKSLTNRNEEILDLYMSGMTYRQIAEKFGISYGRIQQIISETLRLRCSRDAFGKYSRMLSSRTINILRHYDIVNVEQLLELSLERAYTFRGAGPHVLAEISRWQMYTKMLKGDDANG